jgi:quercetin dioxygenase-like cupin family protein
MKIAHYKAVTPDPSGEKDASGVAVRWVIAEKDGAPNFSMRVIEVDANGYTPFHGHPWEHQVFILEGSGILVQKDEETPLSKGDVVFVPPGTHHQFRNTSEERLEFICIIPNPSSAD